MLTIHLDSQLPYPLYEQIYLHIRSDIRSGRLEKADRLPSTRALAAHLSVSRNTVDMAYGQLLSEGYIESRPKSGYYVCRLPEQSAVASVPPRCLKAKDTRPDCFGADVPSDPAVRDTQPAKGESAGLIDFSPFAINTEGFPYRIWRRLTGKCLAEHGSELFLLGDRKGEAPFREAIAKYLYEARGFLCAPDNIIVGAGADYLLQLLTQLLDFPDCIAMENPCYMQAFRIFSGLGCRIEPVPVDASGISFDALSSGMAKAVYLTPSHQYPLGSVLSASRRRQLLNWADTNGRYLIEDDHDSEFRYKGKPIPALKEMDRGDSVIYIGTFSRSIAPAIRAGYMVLPDRLMERYACRFRHYASTVSRIDQTILTAFLSDGYYERHLNKSRKIYKGRHDTLLHAMKGLGAPIRVLGENAGLHLAVQVLAETSEAELLARAERAGVRLHGLSPHLLPPVPDYPTTLLLGFGNLTEDRITQGIRRLNGIF